MLGSSGHFVVLGRKYSLGNDFHLVSWDAKKTQCPNVEHRPGPQQCLLNIRPFILIVVLV